jgi:ferric-dicitrate binding protein FerR (iron transport regulator)
MRMGKLLPLLAVTAGVCLAQFAASDASSYSAKAVTVSGRVSVLRDSTQWAISAGDAVKVQEMIITGPDGLALFQLSDGSTFQVYPNSEVQFRKTLGDWRDLLDVLVGRIRVQIQHWYGQPNPNRVITPTAVISVRGTTFDVEVDEDGEVTTVEVEDGQVEVQHALLPSDRPKIVGPGDPPFRVYRNAPIAASSPVDKATVFRFLVRMMRDWAATMSTRSAKINIPGGGGGSVPGDSCKPGMPGCGSGGPTNGASIPAPPTVPPPPPVAPPPPPAR